MSTNALQGVIPIVPTPFTASGDIDMTSLGSVVEYLIGSGVHGVAVLGMASEGFSLTEPEREAVIRTATERCGGRVPLVAGCSHSSAHAAAQLAVASRKAGADALMVMPPAMGGPSDQAIADYFAAVAVAAEIPVMVQDNPAWTGVTLRAAVFEQLAEVDGVRSVKVETRHPPTTMRRIRQVVGDRLMLFGGLAGNWLPEELAQGVAGTMPGSIMPQVYVRVWQLWSAGSHREARALFHRYHPVIRVTAQPTLGIAMTKHLLTEAGVIAGSHLRSPLSGLSPADREDVEAVSRQLDILTVMRGATPVETP